MTTQKRQAHLQVENLEDRQLLAAGLGVGSALPLGNGLAQKAQKGHKAPNAHRARARVRSPFIHRKPGRGSVLGRRPSRNRVQGNAVQDAFANGRPYVLEGAPAQITSATNGLRGQSGEPGLADNAKLHQAALAHAENLARQDRYGDTGDNGHVLDGHDFVYRLSQVGHLYDTAGENVAYNYGHADPIDKLISQWEHSPGHRENMLRNTFTETGVGVVVSATGKIYADQLFGAPKKTHTNG